MIPFDPHWARLRFGGEAKRWHLVTGLLSICGLQSFDYPRVERSDGYAAPDKGKICKYCVQKALKEAKAS